MLISRLDFSPISPPSLPPPASARPARISCGRHDGRFRLLSRRRAFRRLDVDLSLISAFNRFSFRPFRCRRSIDADFYLQIISASEIGILLEAKY